MTSRSISRIALTLPAALALGQAALALGPAALALATAGGCTDDEPAPAAAQGAPPPAVVEVAPARDGSLTEGWAFLGHVQPALEADLAAAAAGHVQSVKVREGDRVSKGKALLLLDSAKIRADLAAARAAEEGLAAELAIAERQLERIKDVQYPTISEPERERFELAAATTRAQVLTKRAEIQRLQVQLADHTVSAPFAGVVRARHVDPGAWVSVGQPVMALVSLDDLEVHVDVSAELGARLRADESAELLGPGGAVAGARIAGVVPALDTATRTMRVRLAPEPRPEWLIAGMAVNVRFAVTLSGDGVLVPRDAVIRGPVASRVIVYADGVGVPVQVDVIATAEADALVRGDGLAPGALVVIRGNERLRPGQPLQVSDRGAGSAGSPGPPGPPGRGAGAAAKPAGAQAGGEAGGQQTGGQQAGGDGDGRSGGEARPAGEGE